MSPNRQILTLAVANPTEVSQKIKVAFDHDVLQSKATKWEIAVPSLQTRNLPGQEPRVKTVETSLDQVPGQLELAPLSVSLYEFPVK